MVKPSEAEKNLVQTNASGGGSAVGPYGAGDRKLYVGNLHFNMTEFQLKQVIWLCYWLRVEEGEGIAGRRIFYGIKSQAE